MIASEGRLGRFFVLSLEDGDRVPDCIEVFAVEHGGRATGSMLPQTTGENATA